MEIFDEIKDKFDVVKSNIDDCLQPNLISPTPKGYKNEIWILNDKRQQAGDNGEFFFRYLRTKNPKGVEVYFAIQKNFTLIYHCLTTQKKAYEKIYSITNYSSCCSL